MAKTGHPSNPADARRNTRAQTGERENWDRIIKQDNNYTRMIVNNNIESYEITNVLEWQTQSAHSLILIIISDDRLGTS